MQAIRTRYMPPTNSKGARMQAKCEAMTIYVSYDHALDTLGNHEAAAAELCRRMDAKNGLGTHWTRPKVCGHFDGSAYHVFVGGGVS